MHLNRGKFHKEGPGLASDKYAKDKYFWGQVSREDIRKLAEIYATDLKMFGYDVNQYFREIGTPEKQI